MFFLIAYLIISVDAMSQPSENDIIESIISARQKYESNNLDINCLINYQWNRMDNYVHYSNISENGSPIVYRFNISANVIIHNEMIKTDEIRTHFDKDDKLVSTDMKNIVYDGIKSTMQSYYHNKYGLYSTVATISSISDCMSLYDPRKYGYLSFGNTKIIDFIRENMSNNTLEVYSNEKYYQLKGLIYYGNTSTLCTITFDPEMDCSPISIERLSNNNEKTIFSIEYTLFDGYNFPQHIMIQNYNKNKLVVQADILISDILINAQHNDAIFKIELPDGIRINDTINNISYIK